MEAIPEPGLWYRHDGCPCQWIPTVHKIMYEIPALPKKWTKTRRFFAYGSGIQIRWFCVSWERYGKPQKVSEVTLDTPMGNPFARTPRRKPKERNHKLSTRSVEAKPATVKINYQGY